MNTTAEPLPFLVSVPHGGRLRPTELDEVAVLDDRGLFADGDAFTDEIYDLTGIVAHCEIARIARAYVDLNRHPDDRPPENPDGVVKTKTCHGEPIYQPDRWLDPSMIETLLDRYHRPYHETLTRVSGTASLVAGLDCHSMEAVGPAVAADRGIERPTFCLSNANGATCPPELLAALAVSIADAFEISVDEITLNHPFAGGYITRNHGTGALPWIQIEMNRRLYLADPWFDPHTLDIDPQRLTDLRARFRQALHVLA